MPVHFEEQMALIDAANILRNQLASQLLGPVEFRASSAPEYDETIDGGWVTIGRFGDPEVQIIVWLDTYARHDHRCFWVGFSSSRKRPIDRLVKLLEGEPPVLTDADINVDTNEKYSQMNVPLAANLFNQPIRENYSRGGFYLGTFYPEDPNNAEKVQFNMEDSVNWIVGLLTMLPDFWAEKGSDHYSAIENRQTVSYHLRRERDPTLARLCKKRDNYRCQVCEIKLDEVYGEIAVSYAEAHHIVPLSKIDGPVDRDITHLKTVCPNCHRMLHRMKGEEDDIFTLKAMIAE